MREETMMKVEWRTLGCLVAVVAAALLGCRREESASGAGAAGQPPVARAPASVTETQPPLGFLDGPDDGAVVHANTVLTGWALDDSGIAQVTVTIDGQNPVPAALGLPHPGVAAAYPGKPGNESSGFALEIPSLPKGPHSLTIAIQAKNGGKTEIRRQFLIE
jgi:hypothetical protein